MNNLLKLNFFELFEQPPCFSVDGIALKKKYHQLISLTHPDRFVNSQPTEKHHALLLTAHINEAFRTISQPLERATYLLTLSGMDGTRETNNTMPVDFLTEQWEWRQKIDAARHNRPQLTFFLNALNADFKKNETALTVAIDNQKDFEQAALLVKKWRFLMRLKQNIEDALVTVT